jgi:hypothetical protein
MDIQALKHMATVAQAISGPRRILVFGSASLFGTFPSADEQLEMLRRSQDADFIIQPFDEATGRTLNDAIGSDAEFAAQFGYHADIVRPFATENFPPDFESRLVPLNGCPNVFCLDPHDMAVAKLMVGRPKDIALLADLARQQRLDLERVATLLRQTPLAEAMIVKTHRVLESVRAAAGLTGSAPSAGS